MSKAQSPATATTSRRPATAKVAGTKRATASAKTASTPRAKTATKTAAKPKATASAKPKSRRVVKPQPFNLMFVTQAGRLEFESILLAASLRRAAPDFAGRIIAAEPQPEACWEGHHTRISDRTRSVLGDLGVEIVPFVSHHFGPGYPHGNKIAALSTLPAGENFFFFDTDTLFTGDPGALAVDFSRPSASMRREGTWPQPPLYGPGYYEIWKSVYDRFGVAFEPTLDLSQPEEHWERFMYFNAGWFYGSDPAEFGRRMLDWAVALRHEPHDELAAQELIPWLDQIVLPVVIASLGGGRPGPELAGLDGDVSCHYRHLPLLYARESDAAVETLEEIAKDKRFKPALRDWEALRKLVFQGKGRDKIRVLFDRDDLPSRERPIRQQIKQAGWWRI